MREPGISFRRYHYEDDAWHVDVFADNGRFAGAQEFYGQPDELTELGRRLAAFGTHRDDEVRFERGSLTGKVACYVLLRAFIHDAKGHAALGIHFDNNRRNSPVGGRANFHITCDVAALNRLGEDLKQWVADSAEPLTWSPK